MIVYKVKIKDEKLGEIYKRVCANTTDEVLDKMEKFLPLIGIKPNESSSELWITPLAIERIQLN